MQERDGYKEQLVALRDKISSLARKLAEVEELSKSQGMQIMALTEQLQQAQEAHKGAERAWRNEKLLLVQV